MHSMVVVEMLLLGLLLGSVVFTPPDERIEEGDMDNLRSAARSQAFK